MSRCWTVETIIILFLLLVTPSNREGEDYNACAAISLCWAGYFRAKPSCSPPPPPHTLPHLSRERKKNKRVMFSSQCFMDLWEYKSIHQCLFSPVSFLSFITYGFPSIMFQIVSSQINHFFFFATQKQTFQMQVLIWPLACRQTFSSTF